VDTGTYGWTSRLVLVRIRNPRRAPTTRVHKANTQVRGHKVRMSWPVRRVLSLHAVSPVQVATIHLRRTLPHASSGLPGSSGGPPSSTPCLTLLQVGFTEPHRSPGTLVVSYTTVSPLPRPARRPHGAVCSLWHCPAGHPGWVLPTTLPYGARTFLGRLESPTRSPGQLIRAFSVPAPTTA